MKWIKNFVLTKNIVLFFQVKLSIRRNKSVCTLQFCNVIGLLQEALNFVWLKYNHSYIINIFILKIVVDKNFMLKITKKLK